MKLDTTQPGQEGQSTEIEPGVSIAGDVVEAPPPAIVTQPVPTNGTETATSDDEKLIEVRTSDFKRFKEKAREKAERDARFIMEERAKALGFESLEEALELAEKTKLTPPEPQTQATQPETTEEQEIEDMAPTPTKKKPERQRTTTTTDASTDRLKRQLERSEKARKDSVRKWRASEKRRRETQRTLAAKEAEMELREVAIQNGVRDVDYAIRLLTRHLHGQSEDQLAEFDEVGFFTGLRDERPYLFGETTTPATTGTAAAESGDTPAAVEPGDATNIEAENSQFDARKATPDEVKARLRELGVNQPLV